MTIFRRKFFEIFFRINYFRMSLTIPTPEKYMISYLYEMKNTNVFFFLMKNIRILHVWYYIILYLYYLL